MSNKRQTREALGVQDGDEIVLKGTVSFSKLDKLVEGEDLRKENERRQKIGMITADKPFRSVTLINPEIVQGAGTPLANFHGQQVYQNKDGDNAITMESKSLYPPSYGHFRNGQVVEIEDPQKNPATGQVVYLFIQTFSSKGYANLGSTFNAIVFEEGDIDFYEGASSSALKGFGQAMNATVQPMTPSTEPKVVEPEQNQNPGFGGNTGQTQGGFGQAQVPEQNQGGIGGGFGASVPAQDTTAEANPFGKQDSDVASTTGNPVNGPFS